MSANKINREKIYQALFDLVTSDPTVATMFVTKGRLIPQENDVPAVACPALYTFQLPEKREYKGKGISPKRTLMVAYIAYFSAESMPTALPATAVNAAADAIDNIITNPGTPDNVQTLGGLVEHVYIEPDVHYYEGLLQPRSIVVFTVALLVP